MLNATFLAALAFAPQSAGQTPPQDDSPLAIDLDAETPAPRFEASGWNVDIGGTLKVGLLASEDVKFYSDAGMAGVSIGAARLWFESELPDHWRVHFGLRGERGNPRAFFGVVGETGTVRSVDTWLERELNDDWAVRFGKIRPPFVNSGMIEEANSLFFDRSYIGDDWERYDLGAQLTGRVGVLRGWLAAQNGNDNGGNQHALTLRGMWDVVGGGAERNYEGAWNAPDGLSLSVGGAIYYDTDTDDQSAQAIEGMLTFNRLYVAAEYADNGDGLGSLYSWGVTSSFMATEDLEVAARLEDFDRDDKADLYRAGVNYYVRGHDIKWQIAYSSSDSNAPLASAQVLLLGLTVSF